MPYTINPYLPKLRAQAVIMIRKGQSIRQVARYIGVNPSTVSRWNRKVPYQFPRIIPTESSRPKTHPKKLNEDIVRRIIELRSETNGRCAEVIYQHLLRENIRVSLSSVKRTLDRNHLTKKKSKWKKPHIQIDRPIANKPGDLVELDTIHLMENNRRIYVYTLLDLYSRWSYAWATDRVAAKNSVRFVKSAKEKFPFAFKCLQSDHGSEFSKQFSQRVKVTHRHSRIRKPNDNAHIERFNRTLQEELLNNIPTDVDVINKYLPGYLKYYNEQRLHMGINFQTPIQMLA